ncbi:MAG TPA: type III polyketide synthase [Polyangia bacterium]
MPVITSVATAVPTFAATQDQVKAAFGPLFDLPGRRLEAAMSLFEHAEVATRHSVLSLADLVVPRSLTETMRLYAIHARRLGEEVARACLARVDVSAEALDLIVSVSCTGVMIPSVDAFLMDALGTRRDVVRLPITELGCVGGAASVARANDYLRAHPRARALVIAIEFPSLSLQRRDVSMDNLVASALFGDGAAAVLMVGDETPEAMAARAGATGAVRVVDTLCYTRAASTDALGFDLQEDGFHAVLAKQVPAIVRADLHAQVRRLVERAGVDMATLSAFVLHPGGKRILGAAEEALGLTREQTQPSWDTLRDYGNQSSASVLFVLDRWMTTRQPARGTRGVMAAFGPGLTTELSLLEWL